MLSEDVLHGRLLGELFQCAAEKNPVPDVNVLEREPWRSVLREWTSTSKHETLPKELTSIILTDDVNTHLVAETMRRWITKSLNGCIPIGFARTLLEGPGRLEWDPVCKHPTVTIHPDRITCHKDEGGWATVTCTAPFASGCNSFKVRIVRGSCGSVVGFYHSGDLSQEGRILGVGSLKTGYAYYGIIGMKLHCGVSAYGESFGEGDTITATVDFDAGTISFKKNGVSQGIAFNGVEGPLYPAVSIFNETIELVN